LPSFARRHISHSGALDLRTSLPAL
jgi:hypothetical protein